MENLSKFGENLSDLLLDAKYTAKSFSEATGIDRSVVYKYLRGEVMPTLPNLLLIADYFGCSLDYLLGVTAENPPVRFKKAVSFDERFRALLTEKFQTRYRFLQYAREKKVSFAKQSLDDWYHGKRFPSVDSFVVLAGLFHCPLDYFAGRE